MTTTSRRGFLAMVTALASFHALPALAQSMGSQMVMRRPREMGEDETLYRFSQPGPFVPRSDLVLSEVEGTRFVVQAPQGISSAPLIVFSHATLVDPPAYRRILDHLSSHGFAVVAPLHDDAVLAKGLETRRFDARGTGSWEVEAVMRDLTAWKARVESCSHILDRVRAVSSAVGIRIDDTRPLLFGHEYGAYTALLSMGAVVRGEDGSEIEFSDPRWYAACLMAPQGPGILGLEETSWSRMNRPCLIVQGDVYEGFMQQEPTLKAQGFMLSPPGNKHLAWVRNATDRIFFGPSAGTDVTSRRTFEDVLAVTTAFAVAYGSYDAEIFSRLAGTWINDTTGGRVVAHYR